MRSARVVVVCRSDRRTDPKLVTTASSAGSNACGEERLQLPFGEPCSSAKQEPNRRPGLSLHSVQGKL